MTAVSVLMTAAALLGFSCSGSYAALCVWALPYGLGAGSVDAALNNYVALHYASRHMSWLHCMWGVGASLGPYIMGAALTGGHGWQAGYRAVGLIQTALAAVLLLSLPLWRQKRAAQGDAADAPAGDAPNAAGGAAKVLTLREAVRIPGAPEVMAAFFCYCALEQTAGLWAGSYLVLHTGLGADEAASLAGLFYAGITVGRALGGFATLRFSDTQMIRLGQALVLAGVVCLLAAPGNRYTYSGPCAGGAGLRAHLPGRHPLHAARFGAQRSQAMIGLQMASAYVGHLRDARGVRRAGEPHQRRAAAGVPAGGAGRDGPAARAPGAQNGEVLNGRLPCAERTFPRTVTVERSGGIFRAFRA